MGDISGSRASMEPASSLHPSGLDQGRNVVIPMELYHFLMGEGPLDGTWFDEMDRGLGRRGRYWWRALLLSCGRNAAQGIDARERQDAERLDPKDESAVA